MTANYTRPETKVVYGDLLPLQIERWYEETKKYCKTWFWDVL